MFLKILIFCTFIDLELWARSITNMLWYSFGSSIDNPEMLKEKILSIPQHLTNNHEFQENSHHMRCAHEPLSEEVARTRPWFKSGDLAIKKVRNAIEGRDGGRLADLPMMCGFTHTGDIEQYNNLHNKYAPKNVYFSHSSMMVRTALTALDHNANTDRVQGTTREGQKKFELITHRDGKKWFIRKVMDKKSTDWRDSIASFVLQCVGERQRPCANVPIAGQEHIIRSKAAKPDKEAAIAAHQTRGLNK